MATNRSTGSMILDLPESLDLTVLTLEFSKSGVGRQQGSINSFSMTKDRDTVLAYLASRDSAPPSYSIDDSKYVGGMPPPRHVVASSVASMMSTLSFDFSHSQLPPVSAGPPQEFLAYCSTLGPSKTLISSKSYSHARSPSGVPAHDGAVVVAGNPVMNTTSNGHTSSVPTVLKVSRPSPPARTTQRSIVPSHADGGHNRSSGSRMERSSGSLVTVAIAEDFASKVDAAMEAFVNDVARNDPPEPTVLERLQHLVPELLENPPISSLATPVEAVPRNVNNGNNHKSHLMTTDVLSGKGNYKKHVGNQTQIAIVNALAEIYLGMPLIPRDGKTNFAREIVRILKHHFHARFLERGDNGWVVVSNDRARERVSAALNQRIRYLRDHGLLQN